LPPLTADVELAFPDRLIRDADGTLIEVDNRSANLQRQDMNDLKWGFNAWFPFGPQPKGGTPNGFEFSVFDTWVQKDEILIRDGIPILNLLNGAPSSLAGGQPRHQIDWTALIYKDGLGAALNGTWKSATSVSGGDPLAPDNLYFSAIGVVNLRLFVDLARLPATQGESWAHGARIALQVLNVADRRQSVQDSAGATPIAFAPGYLDPVGRTVWLTLRKSFQ
jgi:iron complex outermembrane recepter protein